MFEKLKDKFFNLKNSVKDVERYYDTWTDRYLEAGDNLIEAFRTKDTTELLNYYMKAAGMKSGMRLLDAGCGVCGPSIYFANQLDVQIDAVTISKVQIDIARKLIEEAGVGHKITLQRGDYHFLNNLYPENTFDGVFFLESLGHAENPAKVIKNVFPVLKQGGFLYIKDFFLRETDNKAGKKNIETVRNNINRLYAYNTLELHGVLTAARKTGYKIIFIKSPEFVDDISERVRFEQVNDINIFGGLPEFIPNDWLELKFRKDENYNANFYPQFNT